MLRMPPNNKMVDKQEGGFALLAVLGFMMLFALTLAPFAAASRVRALSASYEYDRNQFAAASAAITSYLAWRLSGDETWRRSIQDGAQMPMSCAIGKIGIEISVLPHAKLIHLNTADRPLLKTGFERIGFDPVQAEELASKVTRYRARRPLETEDSTGIDGGLKHAPFEDISELNDFVELWDLSTPALARVFSVHDGQTMANGLSNGQRTGDAYSIETKLFARGMQVSDAAVFSVDAGTFARLATLEVDTSMQPGSKQNCSQALGGELPNLLAETIR